jgi:hypothetical protein
MTHNKRSPGTIRICSLLAIALTLTVPASAEWKEKVLYSFQGIPDGATPNGAVVFDKAGNLYGATLDGGASTCDGPGQCGTVYKLAPPATKGGAWTETVLYIFKGHAQNDGATPEGGLLIDEAGNLYGTTGYGGSGPCLLLGGAVGCGTVYELSPPAKQGDPWTETVLYSFQGGKDGYVASGDLVFDHTGNLYGATLFGGDKGTTCDSLYGGQCGTVFKLSPPKTKGGKWTEKVLHSFAGGTDGADPNGGLVLDDKGTVYGTTPMGGNQDCNFGHGEVGCGIVFKLSPSLEKGAVWTEKVLHRFTGGNGGAGPSGGLILNAKGSLSGETGGGGSTQNGVVFRLSPAGGDRWVEEVLYAFAGGNDGFGPGGGLVSDSLGNLYGTAFGGAHFRGTAFRLKPVNQGKGWAFSLGYTFMGPPDGAYPAARLVFDKAGRLYSTTQGGGTGQACQWQGGPCGTIFVVQP